MSTIDDEEMAEFENEFDEDDDEDPEYPDVPVDKGWEDVELPDVGTITLKTHSGSCKIPCTCHVTDPARIAEMNAELAARGVHLLNRKRPAGFGAKKYEAVFRALRLQFLVNDVEVWTVYPYACGESIIPRGMYEGEVAPAVPAGGISVRWTDGRRFGGTVEELGDLLGVDRKPTRGPSATKLRIAELEAALARADEVILELSSAAPRPMSGPGSLEHLGGCPCQCPGAA